MLPQSYHVRGSSSEGENDDDDNVDEEMVLRSSRRRPASGMPPSASAPPSPLPLGVTGVLCDTNSLDISGRGNVQYTVFRPRYVHMKPPLVCLAGGPFLPWTYLSTLVHLINDRSLVFFDPIGCGQSKRVQDTDNNNNKNKLNNNNQQKQQQKDSSAAKTGTAEEKLSAKNPIPDMVYDLVQLMEHLQFQHYHLYGHSFGGIVAYEALAGRKKMSGSCLSLTLSSTPANLPQALQDIEQCKSQLAPEATTQKQQDDDDNTEQAILALFAERHECRVRPLPLQLQQSFAMAGFSSSPAGWKSVQDYVVEPPPVNQKLQVPLFLIRGEFDFISQECMDPWWDCVQDTSSKSSTQNLLEESPNNRSITTLPNVAHYGMLEDEEGYGKALRKFLATIKEPALQIPTRASAPPLQRRSRLPR